jgi:hypothetical protein
MFYTATQKLRNYATDYLSLRPASQNSVPKEGKEQTNILLFQCFSTAKMVARKSHNVTSYVHVYCLACYVILNQWKLRQFTFKQQTDQPVKHYSVSICSPYLMIQNCVAEISAYVVSPQLST